MMEFLKLILTIVKSASLICAIPIVGYIYFCEFFGYDKGNSFLNHINFPISENRLIVIGYICAAIFVISIVLQKKIFK